MIAKPNQLETKRIYEVPSKDDGYRLLVDRLWPRGISKEDAKLDEWLKEIAPSIELRKWVDHGPDKFEEFAERYKVELTNKEEAVSHILEMKKKKQVMLLYAAKDEIHNHAKVLKDFLDEQVN